jgi:ABC-type multidrug transport system ATPase subunit
MKVSLTDAGKRFNRDWIFRHFNYTFEDGQSYAITGPNGSGKSTLLQVLGGAMQINEGVIEFRAGSLESGVSIEEIYQHVSICAPYLELIEEMTLKEFLDFHHGFKPFLAGVTSEKIISILDLEKSVSKQIRYYSSGMKQRVKLAQSIFSDTPIVLLDEPCTNLDTVGIELYHSLIDEYCKDRLLVVSSNDEVEYRFCKERINMSDYK